MHTERDLFVMMLWALVCLVHLPGARALEMVKWILVCLLQLPIGICLIAPPLPDSGVRLFLAKENYTLPNYAMVSAAQFRVDDLDPQDGISDAIWCQAAPSLGGVHYQWYGPGGHPVLLNTTLANRSVITDRTTFVVVDDEQVGLARPIEIGIGNNQGFYQCMITEDNGTQHTLVVGVYNTSTYNQNTGPVVNSAVQFSLTSPRDTDPPQFILSFNVSNAPATTVKCSVNEQSVENMSVSRAILNGKPPTLTEVTVTIRQRSAGVYNCTVSNARVEDGTLINIKAYPGYATATVKVTGTPTDVMILVSWTAPTTPVAGYEVFYETAAGERHSVGNTTDTKLTLCGLKGEVFPVFVVAYGEKYIGWGSAQGSIMDSGEGRTIFVLPSARSNVACLMGECFCGLSRSIGSSTTTSTITSTSVTSTSVTSTSVTSSCITTTSVPAIVDTSNNSAAMWYSVSGVLGALLILSGVVNIVLISILIWKRRNDFQHTAYDCQPVPNNTNLTDVEITSCVAYGNVKEVATCHPEEPVETTSCVAYENAKEVATHHPEESVEMTSCVAYGNVKEVATCHPEEPVETTSCVAYGNIKEVATHHPEESVEMISCVAYGNVKEFPTCHPKKPVETTSCVAYGNAEEMATHHPEEPVEMTSCVAYGNAKEVATHLPEELVDMTSCVAYEEASYYTEEPTYSTIP